MDKYVSYNQKLINTIMMNEFDNDNLVLFI